MGDNRITHYWNCIIGGDDVRVFDEVIITNETKFFKKGEKGHVVKVVDQDNAIIYTYRMFHGRVEEIVNKNDFEVIKGVRPF